MAIGCVTQYNPQEPHYFRQAAFWDPNNGGSVTTLENLYNGSTVNFASAIQPNNRVIVGTQETSFGKIHAVAWVPNQGYYGSPNDLLDLTSGGQSGNSRPFAINDSGECVGSAGTGSGTTYHAFRSGAINGVPQELGSENDMGTATRNPTHNSVAYDINENGDLVGASQTPSGQFRAVYKIANSLKDQGWFDLGVLGSGASAGNSSTATGINNHGLIVGTSKLNVNGTMVDRAFVLSNVGDPGSQPMQSLSANTQVWTGSIWGAADSNGWIFLHANKISGASWIIGSGQKNGLHRYFLLYPQ